jgi:outer membrane immunogenic protein
VDLGSQTVLLTPQTPATGTGFVSAKFDNTFDIVRAGLNFKF